MAGSGVVGWNYDSGMKIPVHIPLLDNTASFLTGLSHIYQRHGREDVNIVAVAGDGATADCGFQSLSGAAERGEHMLYVCYDNKAPITVKEFVQGIGKFRNLSDEQLASIQKMVDERYAVIRAICGR